MSPGVESAAGARNSGSGPAAVKALEPKRCKRCPRLNLSFGCSFRCSFWIRDDGKGVVVMTWQGFLASTESVSSQLCPLRIFSFPFLVGCHVLSLEEIELYGVYHARNCMRCPVNSFFSYVRLPRLRQLPANYMLMFNCQLEPCTLGGGARVKIFW